MNFFELNAIIIMAVVDDVLWLPMMFQTTFRS